MTALDARRLRHEAPPGSLAEILCLPDARRPALAAAWQAGPDGRLTCRWDTDDPDASRPPP